METAPGSNTCFSKHLFLSGLRCPTRLFYHARNYPENNQALPFIDHIRYNKRQLSRLAYQLFPGGEVVAGTSIEERAVSTRQLVQENSGSVTLFDALFIWKGRLTKAAVMQKEGREVSLFMVQTKAFHPGKHTILNSRGSISQKWEKYVFGQAYQSCIVHELYPGWQLQNWLLLPRKTATSAQPEELLIKVDSTKAVEQAASGAGFPDPFANKPVREVIECLDGWYRSEKKYPVEVGDKCKNCEFRIEQHRADNGSKSGFWECWTQAPGPQIPEDNAALTFDLIGPGTERWAEKGIYFQKDIPLEEIHSAKNIQQAKGAINEHQRQSLQILKSKGCTLPEEIIRPELYEEIRRWTFPIHFLDFEAGNYAVPVRKERRPYHLLVFQFSCHTLYEDGRLVHTQWIDPEEGIYPNYELARKLRLIPGIEQGTVVQYSNFERTALKNIYKELKGETGKIEDAEELARWLGKLIRRNDSNHRSGPYMADLCRMVKQYYYNCRMSNSLSIKDVLQSVLTVSPHLKEIYSRPHTGTNFEDIRWWQWGEDKLVRSPYEILSEYQPGNSAVKQGAEAVTAYARVTDNGLDGEPRQQIRSSLLAYCELDTLAMVMIYQHWRGHMQPEDSIGIPD